MIDGGWREVVVVVIIMLLLYSSSTTLILMVAFVFFFHRELIYELHKREKEVFLISGGFRSIIEPIAQNLNIPTANIYANRLKFFYDGEWN